MEITIRRTSRLNPSSKSYFIFAIIFLLAGIAIFSYGMIIIKKSIDSSNWPSVQGNVTFSQISSKMVASTSAKDPYPNKNYYPDIRYTYSLNSLQYIGNHISISDYSASSKICSPFGCSYSDPSEESFNKLLDEYPVGKEIQVFYNPKNPQDSLLKTGFNIIDILPVVFGLLFIICSIILIIKYFTYNSQNPQ